MNVWTKATAARLAARLAVLERRLAELSHERYDNHEHRLKLCATPDCPNWTRTGVCLPCRDKIWNKQ